MGPQDLLITPGYLIILYILAYFFRPYFTNTQTIGYYIPALTLKFIGAISLGLVYQFYYGGGDTFNYWAHGSKHIWNALFEEPSTGLQLLFSSGGEHSKELYQYSGRIWYYGDVRSYLIVRIAAFFDIFTLHTYAATALFFACWSFIGSWLLFQTFYKIYPEQKKWIAIATLFIPSVIFWGSGILKDSVTFGALGVLTYSIYHFFYFKQRRILSVILGLLAFWLLFSIKIYILGVFIFAAVLWLYTLNINKIKSPFIRVLLAPFLISFFAIGGYFIFNNVISEDSSYSIQNVARTAAITAYDIRYGWGARTGPGSGYTLGELDGSLGSMLKLFPAAVNVAIYRPYLWEVSNPLMLLSAIESLIISFLTIYFLFKRKPGLGKILSNPHFRFCLAFSVLFAFAVGVSTFNFGTLMRYKIPLMPFYGLALILMIKPKEKKAPKKTLKFV